VEIVREGLGNLLVITVNVYISGHDGRENVCKCTFHFSIVSVKLQATYTSESRIYYLLLYILRYGIHHRIHGLECWGLKQKK